MTTFIVTAPEENYSGAVGKVQFSGGKAVVDDERNSMELAYCRNAGYLVEDDEHAPDDNGGPFDPAEHNADEVLAHLEAADLEEAERVLQAEADGKARKGILNAGGPLLASKKENDE